MGKYGKMMIDSGIFAGVPLNCQSTKPCVAAKLRPSHTSNFMKGLSVIRYCPVSWFQLWRGLSQELLGRQGTLWWFLSKENGTCLNAHRYTTKSLDLKSEGKMRVMLSEASVLAVGCEAPEASSGISSRPRSTDFESVRFHPKSRT